LKTEPRLRPGQRINKGISVEWAPHKNGFWMRLEQNLSQVRRKKPIIVTSKKATASAKPPRTHIWSLFGRKKETAPAPEGKLLQDLLPKDQFTKVNKVGGLRSLFTQGRQLVEAVRDQLSGLIKIGRPKKKTLLDAQELPVTPGAVVEPQAPKVHKEASGFQKFVAGLNHIGLGKERMQFVQNLATMLNAGLPLVDALRTLSQEARTKPMKKLIARVLDRVENGSPLWRAMDEEHFFSPHAIALIRIGEEAGNLAENMEYLAAQEEKDHELRSKVKMAMIYPTIVLSIMFVIVIGLGTFVLPSLIGVLTSLNVKLPLVTRLIIQFTYLFTNYGYIFIPGLIVGMGVFVILAKYTRLKVVVQWVMFRIPGIGSLAREATIARFGVIAGGLLKAGVPVVEAMQSLVNVTPIIVYRNFYQQMLDHIALGDSFAKSFEAIKGSKKLLPPSVQQLIITGEKSGVLSVIMLKVADIYDKKASETAQKLPVILEPLLLLFIGSLVGTIAFAIIVPIYSIVGNVGR
jgi:type IV pilus assembly protein PilC